MQKNVRNIDVNQVLLAGCHGRGAAKPAGRDKGADANARSLHGVHDAARGRAHAGAHDQHLHPAQHRGRLQPAQRLRRARVAPREAALVHRNSLGLLHASRPHIVPSRNSNPLLGQVLRPQRDCCVVGVRGSHTGYDSLPSVRYTFLYVASDA